MVIKFLLSDEVIFRSEIYDGCIIFFILQQSLVYFSLIIDYIALDFIKLKRH